MQSITLILDDNTLQANRTNDSWNVVICDNMSGGEIHGKLSDVQLSAMVATALNEEINADVYEAAEEAFAEFARHSHKSELDKLKFRIFP